MEAFPPLTVVGVLDHVLRYEFGLAAPALGGYGADLVPFAQIQHQLLEIRALLGSPSGRA